jgi:arylsulfatase A-like enzyme
VTSVLVVVFDGLQPAQVTPQLMPNLASFAGEGAAFQRHHAAYPTVTRANVATIVSGCNPGAHGLAANNLVVRELDPHRAIPALEPQLAQLALKTGRVLLRPTLADILSRRGLEFVAVGVGTSGNAFLQNPNAERCGGATIHPEFCLPRALHEEVLARFGEWPHKGLPNEAQMAHAVRIMIEYVLPERAPAVSLLWLSEPDSSQHGAGVGSSLSRRALTVADQQFGRLLTWLQESGRGRDTEVMVASDHGYSTVTRVVEIERLLREAGFPEGAQPGGVVVAPNGGSVLLYVHGGERDACERVAAWLMAQPWCGPVIASRAGEGVPGTLPARLIGCAGDRAPELAMSFAWESRANGAGFAGQVYASSGAVGRGQHGSMSPHETRSVLFARGPGFKTGASISSPSGNVDLAPTILRMLGVGGGDGMDGRVLEEALAANAGRGAVDWSTEAHRVERPLKAGVYRQELTVFRVGKTRYLHAGAGGLGVRLS